MLSLSKPFFIRERLSSFGGDLPLYLNHKKTTAMLLHHSRIIKLNLAFEVFRS